MFAAPEHRLGVLGNIVEADESRFKRHGNVGRQMKAGWFFGLTERLSQRQKAEMTELQQQDYIWSHTIMLSVADRTAATLLPPFER